MKNLVSLDIETSTDLEDERGSILSIAMVNFETRDEFYREIGFKDGLFVNPVAFRVNHFEIDDFLPERTLPYRGHVDAEAFLFCQPESTALGRGISHCDMRFIKRDLPNLHTRFNRRLFDLWGFAFGVCMAKGLDYSELMDNAFYFANRNIPARKMKNWGPHHALYDAWENIFVLEYLNQKIRRKS